MTAHTLLESRNHASKSRFERRQPNLDSGQTPDGSDPADLLPSGCLYRVLRDFSKSYIMMAISTRRTGGYVGDVPGGG